MFGGVECDYEKIYISVPSMNVADRCVPMQDIYSRWPTVDN